MVFNIVGVSLFFRSRSRGGGEDDHIILSGVFLDTVADTLASLVVLVSSLGRQGRRNFPVNAIGGTGYKCSPPPFPDVLGCRREVLFCFRLID